MSERSPEDLAAEAQKLRDEGDPRPVSQIEAELLAADAAEAQQDGDVKDDKKSKKSD